MSRAFYRLENDYSIDGRWYINRLCDREGTELDSREFADGKRVDLGPPIVAKTWKESIAIAAWPPLTVLLDPKRKGFPLDFTFSNESMPVATVAVAQLLTLIAEGDIQRIPVLVESREEEYEIINVTSCVDCIDAERSEIQWYKPGNKVRPDLAGKPEMITELVIDPDRVCGHHIFRLEGWEIAIVVSDVIKNAFEETGVLGVKFLPVSSNLVRRRK